MQHEPVGEKIDESGRLLSVANGNSTTNYVSYDPIGRVTASNQVTGSVTYGFTYSYNLAGALLQETLPDGRVLNTTYDTANRMSGLTGKLSGATTSYVGKMSYWPFGPLAGYQYGNGMVRGTAYDSRMQPIEISDTQAGLGAIAAIAACQGGTTYTNQTAFLLDLQMFWGQSATQTTANNGVLWGILERNCGGTSPNKYATGYNYWQSFNYDALNRLTVANDNGGGGSGAGWNRNYNFDTWGNMWVTNATGIALCRADGDLECVLCGE